jgi:hypothetical protein
MPRDSFDIADPGKRHEMLLRYALGELPAEQSDLLEAALEHDPVLCDELTSVVRWNIALSAAMASAAPPSALPLAQPVQAVSAMRHRRTVVGLSCAALASVVVVLIANAPRPASDLLSEAESFAQLADDEALVDAGDAVVDECELDDPLARLIAPEWLVTAVELDEAVLDTDADPDNDSPDEQELF